MPMGLEVEEVSICSGSMSHTFDPLTAQRFFVLIVAQERSARFRTSIAPPKNLQRRNGALRGDKIFQVNMMTAAHLALCWRHV